MNEIDGIELLRSIFSVIMKKAEADPIFVRDLLSALPAGAQIKLPEKRARTRAIGNVDLDKIHPVNLIRDNKEDFLLSQLKGLSLPDLKKLANNHRFPIAGVSKMKKDQLLASIMDAARNRIANKEAQGVRLAQ
jgi:hypothetical protein